MKNKLFETQNIFIVFSLFYGLLFVFLTPPFQAPDEIVHFFRAYQISEGYFVKTNAPIATSIINYHDSISQYNLPFHTNNKISKMVLFLNLFEELNKNDKINISTSPTNAYSPIGYLPQVMGILLGKLLHFSPAKIFYLSRLINLLFAIFFVILAIKLSPIGKWVFTILTLMPMSLFLMASCSPDSLLISFVFLYISFFFSIVLEKRNINTPNLIFLIIFALFLSLLKTGYVLINLLLLIFLFKEYNLKRKFVILILISVLISLVINVGWVFYSELVNGVAPPPIAGIDTKEQALFIINNPFTFMNIFFTDLYIDAISILKMFVGHLGWLDTPLPNFVYINYTFLLLLTLFSEESSLREKNELNFRSRIFIFIVFCILFCFTYSVFYLTWTPLKANFIQGFQGRYIIPFAPLFFITFTTYKSINKRVFLFILFSSIFISLTSTLITLITRYY